MFATCYKLVQTAYTSPFVKANDKAILLLQPFHSYRVPQTSVFCRKPKTGIPLICVGPCKELLHDNV